MGEDCGTWIPQVHIGWQSPKLIPFDSLQDVGKVNFIPTDVNSGINVIRNGTLSLYGPSELPNLNIGLSNSPHSWFSCSPGFRDASIPDANFTTETLLQQPDRNVENVSTNVISTAQKRHFLVVDQSGDQTTFFFSFGFEGPIHCLSSTTSKLERNRCTFGNRILGEGDFINNKGTALMNEFTVNEENHVLSEMLDDTQEIDALFFSDEESYTTVDDEVTSTGHSPSTVTKHYEEYDIVRSNAEEVSSSLVKMKKRKLHEDFGHDAQLMDTASSLNVEGRGIKYEDAAESSCGSGSNRQISDKMGSFSGSKRTRKERVRDILSALQRIIPGGKDKDPIMLLDEAIYQLKSLKLKAKLLGVDAL